MNFLDTLVSNSICQFSSNFTNTCFVQLRSTQTKTKINTTDLAKALYKLQYILNKKFRALKYFVFVCFEQIPQGEKDDREQKIVKWIQYVRDKYYIRDMKLWGFQRLVEYNDLNVFKGLEKLGEIVLEIRKKSINIGFSKIKENNRLYEKTDIFVDSIDYIKKIFTNQYLKISFSCIKIQAEQQLILHSQPQNYHEKLFDQYFQIQKLTEFKNNYELQKPKLEIENSLTQSMHSMMSIDELYQPFTPSKTDKSSMSRKKKVNLSMRRNHSKSISLHRTEIVMKIKEPLIMVLGSKKLHNIKIDLEIVCAEQNNVMEENNSKPMRTLYPDQLLNDLGDIADNLNVFPWQASNNNNLMKSARLSSFSITNSQMGTAKKKQSTGSILAKSTRIHPNIQDNQKHLCQSFELKKASQTNPIRQTSSALTKKIKSNCIDKKILQYQQNTFNPYTHFNASSKLRSFLKNQILPQPIPSSSKNPKPSISKLSSQQNRSKLRNTSHIQIQKLKNPSQQPTILTSTHKQKVIRKFSPITLIRQKLMNNLK